MTETTERRRPLPTRPAALRLTDADRDRLLSYGKTVRAAVLRLLDLADEHESCPDVPREPTPTPPCVVRAIGTPPAIIYLVDRNDAEPLETTDHALALRTASEHGTRVRRRR